MTRTEESHIRNLREATKVVRHPVERKTVMLPGQHHIVLSHRGGKSTHPMRLSFSYIHYANPFSPESFPTPLCRQSKVQSGFAPHHVSLNSN